MFDKEAFAKRIWSCVSIAENETSVAYDYFNEIIPCPYNAFCERRALGIKKYNEDDCYCRHCDDYYEYLKPNLIKFIVEGMK